VFVGVALVREKGIVAWDVDVDAISRVGGDRARRVQATVHVLQMARRSAKSPGRFRVGGIDDETAFLSVTTAAFPAA